MKYFYFKGLFLKPTCQVILAAKIVTFFFSKKNFELTGEILLAGESKLSDEEKELFSALRPYREIVNKLKNKNDIPLLTTNTKNDSIRIIYPGNIKFKIGRIEELTDKHKLTFYIGHVISKEVFEFFIEIICDLTDINFYMPGFVYIQLMNCIMGLMPETNIYFRRLFSRLNYWAFTGKYLNEIIKNQHLLIFTYEFTEKYFFITALISYLNFINISVTFENSLIVLTTITEQYCNIYPPKDTLNQELSLMFEGKSLNIFFASINGHNNEELYNWIFKGIRNIKNIIFYNCDFSNLTNIDESINCLLNKELMFLKLKNCINVKNYIRNINEFRINKLGNIKLENIQLSSVDLSSFLEFKNIGRIELDNCTCDDDEIYTEHTLLILIIEIRSMKFDKLIHSFLKKACFEFLILENICLKYPYNLSNIPSSEGKTFSGGIKLEDVNINENFFDLLYSFKYLLLIKLKSIKNLSFKIKKKDNLRFFKLEELSFKDILLPRNASNIQFLNNLEFLTLYRIKNISSLFINLKETQCFKALRTLKIKTSFLTHFDIEKISYLPKLENLKLSACNLDSSHLININKITSKKVLRRIILSNNKIESIPIACKGIFNDLQFVILDGCGLNAGSLSLFFNDLKSSKISFLDLSCNSLNKNDLILISGLKKLEVLKLNGVNLEEDARIHALTSHGLTKHLKFLEINNLTINARDIIFLSKFKVLEDITLSKKSFELLKETKIKICCSKFNVILDSGIEKSLTMEEPQTSS